MFKNPLAADLCSVAVHGAGPDADPVKHVGHKVAGVLARHKHQHTQLVGRGGEALPEQLDQLLVLVLA